VTGTPWKACRMYRPLLGLTLPPRATAAHTDPLADPTTPSSTTLGGASDWGLLGTRVTVSTFARPPPTQEGRCSCDDGLRCHSC